MNSPFLNWNLGSVTSTTCQLAQPLTDGRPIYARMRFDRFNTLEFPAGGSLTVTFLSNKDLHFIRERCRAAGWSHYGLPLLRVQRAENAEEARLDFMFPATMVPFTGALPLMVDKEVLEKVSGVADERSKTQFLEDLCLDSGYGRFLIRQAPGFIEDESLRNIVKFFLPSGLWIACRLLQNYRGVPYLHATSVEDVPRERISKSVSRVHLLPLMDQPGLQLIQSPEEAQANELNKLSQAASRIVMAWSQYHRLVAAERKRLFDLRASCPLTFHDPMPEDGLFRISLRNWPSARELWCAEDLSRGRIAKQSINVRLKLNADDPETTAIPATIERVSYEGDAWLDTAGKTPPDKGLVLATEEGDRAAERRKDSVERLQTAQVALPVLMDILNDPARAARAGKKHGAADHRGLNRSQSEAMERAVANESVMAIQGPPGTGKTKVIVEIVRHLFLKRRQNEALRVLVCSTQNDAVQNAVMKLQGEGILIHLNQSREAAQKSKASGLLQRLAQPVEDVQQKLEAKIQTDLNLSRASQCSHVGEDLAAALQDCPEEPAPVLQHLIQLGERWAGSPLVDMLSPWGELSTLRDELKQMLLNSSALARDLPRAKEALSAVTALLATTGNLAESEALRRSLETNETAVRQALGDGLLEALRDTLKLHRRSLRDGNAADAQVRWTRLREIMAEAETASVARGANEPLRAALRQVVQWRKRCLAELAELRQSLAATKAGAVVEWHKALAQDPHMWREICERYSQVVGATAQMSAPRAQDCAIEPYDYVIVDEAGRSDLFDLLIPMTLGRRILLVGDQQQLPPFIENTLLARDDEDDAESIRQFQEELARNTLFRELYEGLPTENRVMLNVQYRMHPAIGDAISDAFYEGQLTSGPEERSSPSYQDWLASKQPRWGLFDNRPLVWIESAVPKAPRCKDHNEFEVHIIRDLVQRALLATKASVSESRPEAFIGVISFYSEQVRQLQEAIATLPEAKGRVEIGTVDSFQGKEYPLTILSCCRHDPSRGEVGFLRLTSRVNVALSRAQCQLIIVGSAATLQHPEPGRGSAPLKDFCRAAGDNLFHTSPP